MLLGFDFVVIVDLVDVVEYDEFVWWLFIGVLNVCNVWMFFLMYCVKFEVNVWVVYVMC